MYEFESRRLIKQLSELSKAPITYRHYQLSSYLNFVSDEISKQLLDSDAKVVIVQGSLVPQVRQALTKIKRNIPVIAIKEQVGHLHYER